MQKRRRRHRRRRRRKRRKRRRRRRRRKRRKRRRRKKNDKGRPLYRRRCVKKVVNSCEGLYLTALYIYNYSSRLIIL